MSPSLLPSAALALAALAGQATAAPLVATDIPPVHSIVTRVMAGVGEPEVVVPPGTSPHGFALRPSAARLIADADAVIWVGEALTPWLDGAISSLAQGEVLELVDAKGVTLLDLREGGPFHAHDHDHDHAQDDHGEGHDHEAAGHDHSRLDAHLWLDPQNGVAMAMAAAELLSRIDPANAEIYLANAAAFGEEMAVLEADLADRLAPVAERPFVVFHDAYQYFENRFHMPAAGSITLGDADQPSAARVSEIRDRISDLAVVCVFAEPQFEPRLVTTVIEGTGARTGVLDPLGAALDPGPDLYPGLLAGLADGLVECLGN